MNTNTQYQMFYRMKNSCLNRGGVSLLIVALSLSA